MSLSNYNLKDEISAYWGKRAETFDDSIGHGVRTERELRAWQALFAELAGPIQDAQVLELASGTGEISRVLVGMGADLTGLDLAEPMIQRARSKLATASHKARFFLRDAEATHEPDDTYDVVICRHLVWTLVDPERAFGDWYRVLRPGGRVVIVDGDWVQTPLYARLKRTLSQLCDRITGTVDDHHVDMERHNSILEAVYFRDGLQLDRAVAMLKNVGFHSPRLGSLAEVEAGQRSGAKTLGEWLRIGGYRRFALSMIK